MAQDATRETSAGGVVFRMVPDDAGVTRPCFLLIRDSYHNWGFPKGHLEEGERPEDAALREVGEETGLSALALRATLGAIDWHFHFRGRLIHKVCHFFLMESTAGEPCPQRSEGITACRWEPYDLAVRLVSYANARDVLRRANEIVAAPSSLA
jgi:8-oxo-dGTP pyrophosphatase MutT (NUDIX family)